MYEKIITFKKKYIEAIFVFAMMLILAGCAGEYTPRVTEETKSEDLQEAAGQSIVGGITAALAAPTLKDIITEETETDSVGQGVFEETEAIEMKDIEEQEDITDNTDNTIEDIDEIMYLTENRWFDGVELAKATEVHVVRHDTVNDIYVVDLNGELYDLNGSLLSEDQYTILSQPMANHITKSKGTFQGPSGKETYYNLPMQRVISYMQARGYYYDYWVRYDGVKMYGPYVMVAANTYYRPKGTILQTSMGLAMVCDHCEAANGNITQVDIAVTW